MLQKGSIKLTFEGSLEGLLNLQKLLNEGKIAKALGYELKEFSIIHSNDDEVPYFISKEKSSQDEKHSSDEKEFSYWDKTIFLAHASEDKPFVRKLYKELKKEGFQPWLDEENLEPGVMWEKEIKIAIEKSRFFLACISDNSVNKNGFIQKELRIALSQLEEKPPQNTYFIPALIENSELPDITVNTINLRDYQAVKLFENTGTERLIEFLKKHIKTKPQKTKKEKINLRAIKELIMRGKTEKALKELLEITEKYNKDYINNVILLLSNYQYMMKEERLGISTKAKFNLNYNRINVSILEIIDLIEDEKKL